MTLVTIVTKKKTLVTISHSQTNQTVENALFWKPSLSYHHICKTKKWDKIRLVPPLTPNSCSYVPSRIHVLSQPFLFQTCFAHFDVRVCLMFVNWIFLANIILCYHFYSACRGQQEKGLGPVWDRLWANSVRENPTKDPKCPDFEATVPEVRWVAVACEWWCAIGRMGALRKILPIPSLSMTKHPPIVGALDWNE